MQLRYVSETSIAATLAEGEALHGTAGPCEISFPAEPGHPYYDAAVESGEPIAAYVPPVIVPHKVQRHQALIALYQIAGITEEMIEAAIAQIEDDGERYITGIRYRQPEWYRDSEFVPKIQPAFGLSDADVDQLFVAAAEA